MKRKRGHKKGKQKRPPVVTVNEAPPKAISINTDDNSGVDEFGNDECNSQMEVDTPSSTGTDQPHHVANINPDGSIDKAAGKTVGRVKVKLKTSKLLDSQVNSSDAPTHSDTDKSSQQLSLEKQNAVTDKMEDSANSLREMKVGNSESLSRKAGSIRIKSSKSLGSSSINQTSNGGPVQKEVRQQKESRVPHQEPQYSKEELDAALSVIKKVMKMDAAEPFNVPVNPVALGIPDYFDVIDTPMDFGTICSNLENGLKYMNSEDVFKDVQYIWENCYKYNNKGDYILDLMRRVKKNFMKYWTGAGLFSDQPRGTNGVESTQAEDVAVSSQGKVHVKSGQSKQKTKKRHGGRRHKNDCLCAICVLKRRRREREESERIARGQAGVGDGNLSQDFKQEDTSFVESPGGEDSSSNMDSDEDADLEEKGDEVKLEDTEQQHSRMEEQELEEEVKIQRNVEGGTPEQSLVGDRSTEEAQRQSEMKMSENLDGARNDTPKETTLLQHEEETAADQQRQQKESQLQHQKAKIYEKFHHENPMLLNLCGVLFPENRKSVWSGPHSLVQHRSSARTSSIHAAIKKLMK